MQKDVILTPEGLEKLKQEIEYLSERQAPRGRRAHQGGPRVRRHLRELRVRRRQERADDARGADRLARGEAALRDGDRRRPSVDSDIVRVGSPSTSRTRSRQALQYMIVGSTEADPSRRSGSPTSRPSARRCSATRRATRSTVHAAPRQGPRAQDLQDRRRASATVTARRRSPTSRDPAAQARRAARRGHRAVPARLSGASQPIADGQGAARGARPGEETDVRARVAGRLAARRGQGKAAFLDLVDRSGRMQLHARAGRARRGGVRRGCSRSTSAT